MHTFLLLYARVRKHVHTCLHARARTHTQPTNTHTHTTHTHIYTGIMHTDRSIYSTVRFICVCTICMYIYIYIYIYRDTCISINTYQLLFHAAQLLGGISRVLPRNLRPGRGRPNSCSVWGFWVWLKEFRASCTAVPAQKSVLGLVFRIRFFGFRASTRVEFFASPLQHTQIQRDLGQQSGQW